MSKIYKLKDKNGVIQVDCRKCINCTGNECIPFGKDADVATKKCAEEEFKNYVTHEELEKSEVKEAE